MAYSIYNRSVIANAENETILAKKIYWNLISSGDTLNIPEVYKLISPQERKVYNVNEGKFKGIKSFITKYSNLFELSRENGKGSRIVRPVVRIEFCKTFDSKQGCLVENCSQLHVCRHFIKGKCTFGSKCKKPHKFNSPATRRILEAHCLEGLSDIELKEFLCRNVQFALEEFIDSSSIPKQLEICKYYNVAIGCSREGQCPFLHVCRFFAEEGSCKFGLKCIRRHNFKNNHAQSLLARYSMREDVVWLYLKAKAEDNKIPSQEVHKTIDLQPSRSALSSCQNGMNIRQFTVKKDSLIPSPRQFLADQSSVYSQNTRQLPLKQRAQSFDSSIGLLPSPNFCNIPMRKFSEPLQAVPCLEICEYAFDGSCLNAVQCRKVHRNLPFSWEFFAGDSWHQVSKQEHLKLEAAFSDVNLTESVVILGENEKFVFKFQHWIAVQRNGYTIFPGKFSVLISGINS